MAEKLFKNNNNFQQSQEEKLVQNKKIWFAKAIFHDDHVAIGCFGPTAALLLCSLQD